MFSKIGTQIFAAVSSLVVLIFAGSFIFHYLEDWTWIQSFYFSVVTLTTVGYGDLHPTTDTSRLIASLYILLGVAIVFASLGIIGTKYLSIREKRIAEKKKKIEAKRR
jgi:hypothetical protein